MKDHAALAAQLRTIAATVRDNPHAREAIAAGFDLVADAMAPCIDCGHPDAAPQGTDDRDTGGQ